MANTVPEKLKVRYTEEVSMVYHYKIASDELATEFANDVRERLSEDYPGWEEMDPEDFQTILLDTANEVFFHENYDDKSHVEAYRGDVEWSEFDFIKGEE